jgi:SNF2 family DNA or RNA helicase
MLLPRRAVEQYLARPFLDWSVYKDLSDRQLTALAAKYRVPDELWAKLRDRPQRIMTLIGLRQPRFLFFADMGMGKSFVALALAQLSRSRGLTRAKTLILVPQRSNKDEWGYEIEKHFPQLPFAILPSDQAGKWAALESEVPIVIETYAGLYALMCQPGPGKRGKSKLQPNLARIRRVQRQVDGLVLDESTYAKSKNKLPFRLCRQLAKHSQLLLGLTGTPHGRDPTDLWGQFFLADGGETLGQSLGLFRAAFFSQRSNGFGVEYHFLKKHQARLNQILNNRSIRFKAEDSELPELLPIRKYLRIGSDAMTYYQRYKAEMLRQSSLREIKGAFLRLRQISSGFVGYKDDDSGERATFVFPDNPKLELLLDKLQTALPAKQIVYYEFTWSAMRIRTELDRLGIGWQHLWSGTTDTDTAQRLWREDERYPVLLIQSQFGIGLNLQAASYGHFYESPVSPIIRKQCERRFRRQGSSFSRVYQYDYVMRNTVDEAILDMIAEGYDLMANIIDGRKRL